MTTWRALHMGALKIFESMPTATFPEIRNGILFRLILWMCVKNLKYVALPVPEIIAIEVLGGGCWLRTSNLGKGGIRGLGGTAWKSVSESL